MRGAVMICVFQRELAELEEKYRKSMLNNAQLDTEKQTFRYQVDLSKDQLEDLREQLVELTRLHKDKCRVSVLWTVLHLDIWDGCGPYFILPCVLCCVCVMVLSHQSFIK